MTKQIPTYNFNHVPVSMIRKNVFAKTIVQSSDFEYLFASDGIPLQAGSLKLEIIIPVLNILTTSDNEILLDHKGEPIIYN